MRERVGGYIEAHEDVSAFLYYATRREGSVPDVRDGGQRGWLSNGRTGWSALELIINGLVGVGVSQVPTVYIPYCTVFTVPY